jgi:hypothetical protein
VPIWNSFPDNVDFSSLARFENSVRSLNFTNNNDNLLVTLFSKQVLAVTFKVRVGGDLFRPSLF